MAKKQFSDVQTFITLTLVCVGAAAVLALVDRVTQKPIERAEARKKEEALRIVLPPETASIETRSVPTGGGEIEVNLALDDQGQTIGYAISSSTDEGYGGDVEFLLGLDREGSILTYKIMNHKETPGLGDNLTSEKFKSQFKGKNLDNFQFKVAKDGGDVQAITAATISSRAACKALEKGLELFQEYRKAPGGQSSMESEK